jgi:hypothetical protein
MKKLELYSVSTLHTLLAYERQVESQRQSAERVARSLRKIAQLEAELAKRTPRAVQ